MKISDILDRAITRLLPSSYAQGMVATAFDRHNARMAEEDRATNESFKPMFPESPEATAFEQEVQKAYEKSPPFNRAPTASEIAKGMKADIDAVSANLDRLADGFKRTLNLDMRPGMQVGVDLASGPDETVLSRGGVVIGYPVEAGKLLNVAYFNGKIVGAFENGVWVHDDNGWHKINWEAPTTPVEVKRDYHSTSVRSNTRRRLPSCLYCGKDYEPYNHLDEFCCLDCKENYGPRDK